MRRYPLSLVGALLLVSLATAGPQGKFQGEPLLPTQGVAVEKLPVSPDTRPVLVKWRYPGTTRSAPSVAVWLSVDGGPWAEIGRTVPGALNFSYPTSATGVTHCTYLVPLSRSGIEGKPSPTVCEFIDEIPTPTDVSVQAQ